MGHRPTAHKRCLQGLLLHQLRIARVICTYGDVTFAPRVLTPSKSIWGKAEQQRKWPLVRLLTAHCTKAGRNSLAACPGTARVATALLGSENQP